MKNWSQGAQNPSRFDLAVPNPCQIVARSSQNRFLDDLGVYLGGQSGLEICEILCKFEENCNIVCTSKIMMIFWGFLVAKRLWNQCFWQLRLQMQISWKSLFFLSKINVFQVRTYQKSHQNRVRNTFEKKVLQKSNLKWIWSPFSKVLEHQSASKRPRKSELKKHWKFTAKLTSQPLWFPLHLRSRKPNPPPTTT